MQNKITFKQCTAFFKKVAVVLCVVLLAGAANAQTVSTASGTGYTGLYSINNAGALTESFVIQNTGAVALTLNSVSTQMAPYFTATAGAASVNKLYYSATSLSGVYDVSTAAWTQIGTGASVVPAALTVLPAVTGLSFSIPAGTQYRFVLELSKGLAFSYIGQTPPTPTPNSFTNGAVTLKVGDNLIAGSMVGYGGVTPAAPAGNSGLFFGGSVTLTPSVLCTGTPAPGATTSTAATVCPGTPFTLSPANATSGTGVTYQWQSSATGAAGSYVNIPGATSSTYTVATQATSTYYQVIVTCSGNSGTSTPLQVVTNPPSACYCTPAASNCSLQDDILNVTFAGINNTSTCSANGYANYTAGTPATVVAGGSYPISVTIDLGGGDAIGVWIDYNHSGSFDPGEFTLVGITTGGTVNNTVVIPGAALTGNTRMRVRSHFSGAMTGAEACTAYLYGETEDYTVNIQPCVAVQISSSPANQSVSCGSNATFTVAATGSVPTYQWEYRTPTTPAGVWLNVPAGAPYSGQNTATLTITGATTALSGNQYRAMVAGACAGPTPSAAATLTVNPIVAVITPATATVCTGGIQQLSISNTLGNSILLNENFDTGVPATWTAINRSTPAGTTNWAQGQPAAFPAHSGAANSYVESDYQAAAVGVNNTISNWLITPVVSIKNGDVFTFWTRTLDLAGSGGVEYPDRLEVRLSTNNASTNVGASAVSVGDFTNLLLTINPTQVTGVYPMAWTQYTVTVSGVAGTVNGRMAFRAFETDNGSGANEDYIGIDDAVYTSTGAPAAGVWTGPAGTIFTNAAGTTPYNGTTPLNSVYVAPTAVGANTYSVNFTSSAGACTSTTATSVVTVNTAPAGTLAVANITTCANSSVTFSFTGLTAGTGLTYQWQVSTNNGVSYSNIAGATSATYTITSPATSQNGNKYRVLVSSTGCAATLTSGAGTLTVNPIPVVTISAAPIVNIYPGLTSTLTAAVSSATAPLSYQWFLNGNAVPGATSNTYTVSVDGEGSYSVQVTDANGCVAAKGTSTPGSISIGDSSGVTILFIYPSPNSGQFQVRYFNDINNGGTAPAFVNVYDSKGARVFTRQYTLGAGYQAMKVDMGTHTKGLYRVELVDLNGNRIKTGSVMVF